MIDVVIGIVSAPNNHDQRSVIRQTWAKHVPDNVQVLFVVGTNSTNYVVEQIGDMLLIPMEESYGFLPYKSRMLCSWAVNNTSCRYVFKCDDDTYVDVDKLMTIADGKHDYIGNPCVPGVASGGAGYLLSRRAAACVGTHMNRGYGSEDVLVAKCLFDFANITLQTTTLFDPAHYGMNHVIPLPNNQQITTHYVNPKMMVDIYKRNNHV